MPIETHAAQTVATRSKNFRPDIEGLRAIAILLVTLYHGGISILSGGYIGVDVFFVLSGYLITGLLVRELETTGRVNLSAFYARRARRLLPAAALMIMVTLLLAQTFYPPQELISLAKDALTTSLYSSNLWFAHNATDYLAADADKSPFLHTWSLSVEEQFYLAWPLLLMVALRNAQPGQQYRRRLLIVMTILGFTSFLAAQWLMQVAKPWAFFASPTRAWEFAVGGLASQLPEYWKSKYPRCCSATFWLGCIAILTAALWYDHHTIFPGLAALLPVLGTATVLISHQPGRHHLPAFLLDNPPLQWLGQRSYSWYLWHWPILVLAQQLDPTLTVRGTLMCLLLSLLLADLTYSSVENPVRTYARLAGSHWRSLLAAACLMLATVGLSQMWWRTGSIEANSPDQIKFTQAMQDLPQGIYDNDCHLNLLQSKLQRCEFGDTDSPTSIVLFGDSHAAQWFPAIEAMSQQQGLRLVTFTKSACPIAWTDTVNRQLGRRYTECSRWRKQALQKIIALHPALVVVGYYRYVSLPEEAGGAAIRAQDWLEGMHHTMQMFNDAGIQVVVMRDSPRPGFDVPTCLARQAKSPWRALNCRFQRSHSLDNVEYHLIQQASQQLPYIAFIDLSERICQTAMCDPFDHQHGVVLFRDAHHLTTRFVRQLVPTLTHALSPWLARAKPI